MDGWDWKIVSELETDGRLSYADLGERVGLSKSPCWTRVRALETGGVISGYGARLEPAKLGLAVQSFVQVSIGFDAHAAFEQAVLDHPAIVECHTTAGDSDYLLRVYCGSVEQLDDLLRHDLAKLPGVVRLSTLVCLKSIKRNGPLAQWARSGG